MSATAIDGAPLLPAAFAQRPLDLREVDLRNGSFAGADLRDCNLAYACLAQADLSGADLRGARLCYADLALCDLSSADLRNADLSGADLSGADLRQARLDGADLADAELAWARLAGARGLDLALATQSGADGRVGGPTAKADPDEPAAGLAAYERGRKAHLEGALGLAERHFRTAIAWVPQSDVARYALACVALDRGDAAAAARYLQEALAVHLGAERARLDLAALAFADGELAQALEIATPLLDRTQKFAPLIAALQANDLQHAENVWQKLAADTPGARWLLRHPPSTPRPPQRPTPEPQTERLGDENWIAQERLDLLETLKNRQQPAWLWHGVIARAIALGALDIAQRAEQRLTAVAPEHRLWGLELKHLDLTAQSFESLVRTRRGRLGQVHSVRWVAIGAHGPTARLQCDAGVFFAKRYVGAHRSMASVAFSHRALRHLHAQGAAVPLPLLDDEGNSTMAFGDDWLALYPRLPGAPLRDLDQAAAQQMGETLALLHRAGANFALGAGRPRGGVRIGTRTIRHASPSAAWQVSLGQDPECAAIFERHPMASRLLSLLDATGRRLRGPLGDCPTGLVHGDFAAGNVLWPLAGETAPLQAVDWDLADGELLIWDLARTIDLQAVHWAGELSQPVEILAPIARAIVRGYTRVRPLLHAERLALPLLIAASRIDLDATVLPLCARLEPDVVEPIVAHELQRLSRATAGAPELQAVFAA